MIAEWIVQLALSVFLIIFLLQVEAFYTALYLSACVYIILLYGVEVKIDDPYDVFRVWITVSASVLILNYLSNLFARKATPSVDEA